MKKLDLKKLGIQENYYFLDDEGNFHYLFLAPGRDKKDFDISYTGNRVTVTTGNTKVSVLVQYRGHKFDLGKATSEYRDGMLIISVPPRKSIVGKIAIEGV